MPFVKMLALGGLHVVPNRAKWANKAEYIQIPLVPPLASRPRLLTQVEQEETRPPLKQ